MSFLAQPRHRKNEKTTSESGVPGEIRSIESLRVFWNHSREVVINASDWCQGRRRETLHTLAAGVVHQPISLHDIPGVHEKNIRIVVTDERRARQELREPGARGGDDQNQEQELGIYDTDGMGSQRCSRITPR